VGVTPAAAYKHFVHKDALLGELAAHGFELLRQRFEAAAPKDKTVLNAKQAIQRFEQIGQAYVQFGQQEPALFHLIFGKGASSHRQQTAAGEGQTPTFSYFANALADLFKFDVIGKLPTAHDQWFGWSAIHGATELVVARVSTLVNAEQAAKVITTNVMKALK
jgi:AcrR family transcriptional regulator